MVKCVNCVTQTTSRNNKTIREQEFVGEMWNYELMSIVLSMFVILKLFDEMALGSQVSRSRNTKTANIASFRSAYYYVKLLLDRVYTAFVKFIRTVNRS